MKIALLGPGPLALEAALRFHSHGAQVTWFRDPGAQDFHPTTSKPTWSSTTTELGLSLLKTSFDDKEWTKESWTHLYRDPILEILKGEQELKPFKVLSIAKRYLKPKESIPGRSRFADLFRIIYQLNPSDFVEKQKETDPEMYERLSQELVESLQSTLEMYDDFDLVLNLEAPMKATSINETGRALGEQRVSADKVTRGYQILHDLSQITSDKDVREMILVGSTELGLETLLALKNWVRNPVNRLFFATTEEVPFQEILKAATNDLKNALSDFMSVIQSDWEKEMTVFHDKLRGWQELDDFVQAKKPKPVEPIPQVNFFSGHNVTAIDQLIDRKRLFLTLEKPEFRQGQWQPENNFLELKTLGVDHVLVATNLAQEIATLVDADEKGYFSIVPLSSNVEASWEKNLLALKGIEDEVFKLFSPAHTS